MKVSKMKFYNRHEIEHIATQFNSKSLPKSEWDHVAHLLVAFWHNKNFDFYTALSFVKSGIKAYNRQIGTANTQDSGYHETLTIFWMILTLNFLFANAELPFDNTVNKFLHTDMAQRNVTSLYYNHERLFSTEARQKWLNGDLKKIRLSQIEKDHHFHLTDDTFKIRLRDKILDPKLFNHEAHLRLAWLSIKDHGIEDAPEMVNKQIMAYVTHIGARDKFNMTLTIAAVKVVYHFVQQAESDNFADFILEFPRIKTNFKDLISQHYGFDIFNSQEAKEKFLEPDLLPFDNSSKKL